MAPDFSKTIMSVALVLVLNETSNLESLKRVRTCHTSSIVAVAADMDGLLVHRYGVYSPEASFPASTSIMGIEEFCRLIAGALSNPCQSA
jgi:hypothetical protein